MKKILFILISVQVFLLSCSKSIVNDKANSITGSIKNRMFFIIHGDGSYLFHDQNGNALEADQEILKKAIYTAQNLHNSEIFIFHIKKKKHFLFFFPQKDRDFYHFRNGQLVAEESYFNKGNMLSSASEMSKVKSEINNSQDIIHNYFFYYGHEIPETDVIGYHSSYPERKFNIDSLSVLIKDLSKVINDRFDLITLSTCNNGNPYSIYKTLPYSRFVLASPGDLHLSYIDCRNLINPINNSLSLENQVIKFARTSFDSLSNHTNTIVVLSLYNSNLVFPELQKLFDNGKFPKFAGNNNEGFIDCSRLSDNLLSPQLKAGTKVFYRAPMFGKMKNIKSHSGWGCPPNNTIR